MGPLTAGGLHSIGVSVIIRAAESRKQFSSAQLQESDPQMVYFRYLEAQHNLVQTYSGDDKCNPVYIEKHT